MIYILIAIAIFLVLRWAISAWLKADGLNDDPWDFGHKESE
jgi:hypothetical protein